MNLDERILHEQYARDEREPEPIEWVYFIVIDGVEYTFSTDENHTANNAFLSTVQWAIDNEEGVKIELCKVNRELFSHKDWQTAYKQSEIIETKTL